MKDVQGIMNQWLIDNGYDGLVHPVDDCDCFVDSDGFMLSCGGDCGCCLPGYRSAIDVEGNFYCVTSEKEAVYRGQDVDTISV